MEVDGLEGYEAEDDVEYALAWQQLQRETCPGCGEPKAESYDPDNSEAYEVHTLRCHACAARDARGDAIAEDDKAEAHGLSLYVTRKPRR